MWQPISTGKKESLLIWSLKTRERGLKAPISERAPPLAARHPGTGRPGGGESVGTPSSGARGTPCGEARGTPGGGARVLPS